VNWTCSSCGAVFDPAKATGRVCPECGQWDPDDDWNHEAALAYLSKQRRAAGDEESDADLPPAPGGKGNDPLIPSSGSSVVSVVVSQSSEESRVTKEADVEKLWEAGGCLWVAFIERGGHMPKKEALEVAANCGYQPQAIPSHIGAGWLLEKSGEYVFTEHAWRNLAKNYRAYREMKKGS
jgi:predicted  nucleic acid-binding Zn-ribbon protein